ncbi:ABC transporter ATP-binding protein [Acidaminobacterium chupaoyuni]
MSDCLIKLENIRKDFGSKQVLKSINLDVRNKEFVTFLGPSGCGKTTTLRIIGGFESPDSGTVYFDGKAINNVPPHKRRVNTVFQRYALFTHLNVYENIAFGLRINHKELSEKEISSRVSEMLTLVNLSGYEKRQVSSLSGGEQQRVAIARALINHPQVLLLDEPLGALDLKLRKEMQTELKRIQLALGITFIYVTHDQEEALTMSDTIVVMNKGRIQQVGTPIGIYNEPSNAFVADFIGESNIVDGVMDRDFLCTFAGKRFECTDKGFAANEAVDVVIRPEDMKIVPPSDEIICGTVESIVFKGVHYEMNVRSAEGTVWLVHSTIPEVVGTFVGLQVAPFDIHIMKKTVEEAEE